MKRRSVCLIVMAALCSVANADNVLLNTANGPLVGERSNTLLAFKGIRYAAPVTDANRWRPPQPVAPWEQPRDARNAGPECPQHQRPRDTTMAEDCLTLNVWSFVGADKAPVMVWIHGGAFRQGSGSRPIYDGESFAREGVVLVTLNYRLGRFGFFAHPSLENNGGNYGLMDQVAALEWVQANIAGFGGDPDNVTIFGESAGGTSVLYLLTSPKTEGLFHKAIVQSGSAHQFNSHLTLQRARRPSLLSRGLEFKSADTTAEELRALPAVEVLGDPVGASRTTGPVVDDDFVPADPGALIATGKFHKVPVIVGANSDEASVLTAFMTDAETALTRLNIDIADLEDLYSGRRAAAEAWGDVAFVAGARHVAASVARHDADAWLYHFDYVLHRRRRDVDGAVHGADVPYVFNTLDEVPFARQIVERRDHRYAEKVHAAWIRFARTGNPNGGDLPQWPAYTQEGGQTMVFGSTPETAVDFRKPQLDFHQRRWDSLAYFVNQL